MSQLTDDQPNAKFLVPLDVSKDEQIKALMEKAASDFGKIDFLLHSIAFANTDLAGAMDHRFSILEAQRAVEQLLEQVITG